MSGSMIGRVFNNRYKILERIGIGGMAEVYRAQDQVLGRIVAVKVMLPQYASDPEFALRFRQEAASAANLQSPYIVNVYDWGQDEGTYYIVMEFVHGSDLKTAIQSRHVISQRKAAEIGAQVCKALSVAHNQDIIHRDIKPQNIMVQPDGNVKVMDFGIARAKNSVKTQTSAVLGTAHYISPEQAQGKELTAASDIYSLGIVLYEAITGKVPFDAPDSVSVAMKQVSEQPVPPSQLKLGIDPGLEAIIMRAMQKNPNDRFATANDMKAALNDYLAGRTVNVDIDQTNVIPPARPVVPVAGTSVMPQVDNKGVQTQFSANEEIVGKNPDDKRGKKGLVIAGVLVVLAVLAAVVYFVFGAGRSEAVPDVSGKTVSEATVALQSKGFTLGTTTEVFDGKVASGKVISSDPKAGTMLRVNESVNLTVSKGKDQVAVPDLTNRTKAEAEALLAKAGFEAKEGVAEFSDSVEESKVIRTDPKAESKVDSGSTVTYYLSKGPEMVAVPDLAGMNQSQAEAALTAVKLVLGEVSKQESTKVEEGLIISSNPATDTKVAIGTTVNITVSSGKPKPPNVVGDEQEYAIQQIEAAGYYANVIDQASDSVPAGLVIRQTTSSNGTTVNLYVSTGPDTSSSSSSSSKSSGGKKSGKSDTTSGGE